MGEWDRFVAWCARQDPPADPEAVAAWVRDAWAARGQHDGDLVVKAGAVRLGDGGPVIGSVTGASVVEGQVRVSGTFADGRAFEGVAGTWPEPLAECDWFDVDEARHRPLPLPEGWRW